MEVVADHRGDIEWHGRLANRGQIRLVRPTRRSKGYSIESGFYHEADGFGDDIADWLMWNLIFSLSDIDSSYDVGDVEFETTEDPNWEGFGGGQSGGAGASGSWDADPASAGGYPGDAPYLVDGSQPDGLSPVIVDPFPVEEPAPQANFGQSAFVDTPVISEPNFQSAEESGRGFDNVNSGFDSPRAEVDESPVTSFESASYSPTNGY